MIGGGTPLADARAFGQWKAADRLERFVATESPPDQDQVTRAFWGACHGGQREAAEYLLARGANINWIGHEQMTPLDVARRSSAEELVGEARARELVAWLRERGARSAEEMG